MTPDTPRAAVESALQALQSARVIWRDALCTHITEAISGAVGEVDHQLTIPAADVVPAARSCWCTGRTWL